MEKITVLIKGAGDIASGVAWRLYQCHMNVLMTETENPLAVRRAVSFCEAVYDGQQNRGRCTKQTGEESGRIKAGRE